MKICSKCKETKDVAEFYNNRFCKDGKSSACKACTLNQVKSNYRRNKESDVMFMEKERKRSRDKYNRLYSDISRKTNPKHTQKYWDAYPEKRKARLKAIVLKKPFEGAEKHHWSYNEVHYKDVIWLTKKDHMKAHRFIVYDQERMMYRRYDNNVLLDTKEEHINFINYCITTKEN